MLLLPVSVHHSHSTCSLLEQHPVVIWECEECTEECCEGREQQLKEQQTNNVTGSQQCAPGASLPPEHARDGRNNDTLDHSLTAQRLKTLDLQQQTPQQQQRTVLDPV
eukprot:GHUV01017447.1.p2 GENE.GHUV01017447.1~~GHUV01017447.1.p2  ORF type:complete len:108 (-),score=29.18 GHUV01017447.1:66-389(-)